MTRAIGYVRVSTEEQAEHGVSLQAQEAKLRAYCTAMDLTLVRIEVDAGVSAKSLNRPGLQRALAALKREADAIIVVKLDRLSRSVKDTLTLVETHFRGERSLISLSESIDTRTAAGRMIVTVLSALAQLEREQIGERTSAAMAHLKSQGRYTGGRAPYGYQVQGDALVACERELTIIGEVKALRAAGVPLRGIVATLNERGHRSRTGLPFQLTQVANMLAD